MRRFGRQCRGMGKVFVTLVRQTETALVGAGTAGPVLGTGRPGSTCMTRRSCRESSVHAWTRSSPPPSTPISGSHPNPDDSRRARRCATARSSTRTIPPLLPFARAKAIAPRSLAASPASSPSRRQASSLRCICPWGIRVMPVTWSPWSTRWSRRSARVRTRPVPAIHSLAGDLAFNDTALREALHARGILTVGIPKTVAPLPLSPTPEDVLRILDEADLHHIRTPTQVHLRLRLWVQPTGGRKPHGQSVVSWSRASHATKAIAVRSSKPGWRSWRTTRPPWCASTSIVCRSGHARSADGCA